MLPYYQDEDVKIYHGEAVETLAHLESDWPELYHLDGSGRVEGEVRGLAHLVATDPPYFRTIDAEWDDQWGADPQAFLEWLGQVLDQLERLTDDRGTIGVFCSPEMSCGVETEVRRRFAYLNHIVWRKPGFGRLGQMDKETLRRFFPTSERIILAEKCRNPDGDLFRFRDTVNHTVAREVYADVRELMADHRDLAGLTNRQIDDLLGTSGMAAHYFGGSQWCLPTEAAWDKIAEFALEWAGYTMPPWAELAAMVEARRRTFDAKRREFDSHRREFESGRRTFESERETLRVELLSDVWTFDTVPPPQRTAGHPTQKPLPLMEHLIDTMSRPGDLVLDPFMGTGTTLVAAQRLGRRAIGIEMDERYCEAAAERLGQKSLPFGEVGA